MSAGEIRAAFVFYIGAGAVASAGIIALARSLPTIVGAFRAGSPTCAPAASAGVAAKLRTDDDLPSASPSLARSRSPWRSTDPADRREPARRHLIIIFGFFFTTCRRASAARWGAREPDLRLTIAALIAISFIFLLLGGTRSMIACAPSRCLRDRRGGREWRQHVAGPEDGIPGGRHARRQQIAILIGAIGSALAVGWTLTFLNGVYTYPSPKRGPASWHRRAGKSSRR